ncbi:MAG: hypothetical protein ACTSSH_01020, partial [Candidatus Heimdallarchaeota archaeon]
SEPFTWNHLDKSTPHFPLEENAVDISPESVNSMTIIINNNVRFEHEYGTVFSPYAIAGKRETDLKFVGFTKKKTLFDFWRDTWVMNATPANCKYSTATTRIVSDIYLERGADDYIQLYLYNLMFSEHNCHFHTIDETIKGVDIVLTEATPDATRKMFTDGTNNCEIKDGRDNTYYHYYQSYYKDITIKTSLDPFS